MVSMRPEYPASPARTYSKPPVPRETVLTDELAIHYLTAERGIPDWVIEEARITSGTEYCPDAQEPLRVLRFPYYRGDELVNIKYRGRANGKRQFWSVKDAQLILYGLNDIRGAETICIVEGEIDKLSIDAANGPPTVSVPNGVAGSGDLSNASLVYLSGEAQDHFHFAKRVLIATDTDEPGMALGNELARRIGFEKCRRVRWPEGCKDANEVLVAHGVAGIMTALEEAAPYPVEGIITGAEIRAGPLRVLREHGFERGKKTEHWRRFDEHLRARPGLLYILTGQPGHGKSVFLDNWMTRLAEEHGWKFAVCSPENQPVERHFAGLMQIRAGKPFDQRMTNHMSDEEYETHGAWVEQHFDFILPDEPTVESILNCADALVYRGITGLIIDPWSELDHVGENGENGTEYVSRCLSMLRNWARRKKIMVILAAHPRIMHKKEDEEHYPVPTLYQISGSAHFNNKADVGIAVWRNMLKEEQPSEVHIQKVRFQETGTIGAIYFGFETATGVMEEA
jgi:twinkle protein